MKMLKVTKMVEITGKRLKVFNLLIKFIHQQHINKKSITDMKGNSQNKEK